MHMKPHLKPRQALLSIVLRPFFSISSNTSYCVHLLLIVSLFLPFSLQISFPRIQWSFYFSVSISCPFQHLLGNTFVSYSQCVSKRGLFYIFFFLSVLYSTHFCLVSLHRCSSRKDTGKGTDTAVREGTSPLHVI